MVYTARWKLLSECSASTTGLMMLNRSFFTCEKRRLLIALSFGAAFVLIIGVIGYRQIATPIPFWMLLPGFAFAALVPGSELDPEGSPFTVVTALWVFVGGTGFYGGIVYFFLRLIRVPRDRSCEQKHVV
jgi:hypothetical protein